MASELSQIVDDVAVFKGFLPPLNNLPLPDIPQHLVAPLNGLQLRPQNISLWSNQISQPLKENIIAVNQETSTTIRTRIIILQAKEHQLKET